MNVPPDLVLHHIGVATRSIERELPYFEALGYRAASGVFTEPEQKVRGMFIAATGQPALELLENLEESGPLDAPLTRGVKLYHFAYQVENIEKDMKRIMTHTGDKVIVPAMRGAYFQRICFVMLRNMMLIELVETGGNVPANAGEYPAAPGAEGI